MRIRWRGLELPSRVVRDEQVSTDTYAKFTAEPFERGFGTTVGNSLRRILLSSLEGAAVTHIRLKGAEHEFSSLPGVMEDVTDIILNIKSLVVKLDSDDDKEMKLVVEQGRSDHRRHDRSRSVDHDRQQGPRHRHADRGRDFRYDADGLQGPRVCHRRRRTSRTPRSRKSA